MNETVSLYSHIATTHGLTGLFAKVTLLAVLGAVAGGNRKPGQQLLTLTFAAMFFVSFFSLTAWLPPGTQTPLIPSALMLTLALTFGIAAFKPEGEWAVKSPVGWKNALAYLALAFAFYYPVFRPERWIANLFLSPTGALPQPALLVAAVVTWQSAPNAPRLAGWAASVGALILGAVDVFLFGLMSSTVLIAAGGLAIFSLIRGTVKAGGILEDDIPPKDIARAQTRKAVVKKKSKELEERRWNLK
ncbi:MAG: hypothetical protein RLY93_12590 [Sumerlaeia bacterium]